MPHPALGLGFARSRLDRTALPRDGEALARHAADPSALTVVIAGEVPILLVPAEGGSPTALMPLPGLDRLPGGVREQALLGTWDGRPALATLLDPGAAEAVAGDPGFQALDLRSIAVGGVVPEEEAGLLAAAKSVLSWHARHRFCANCGAPTAPAQAGFRRDCGACSAQHFPRTDPVVIMLVTRGDHCLLGRQARFPAGNYSCLAGFLEPGETVEDAVRREVREEAGIGVGRVAYHSSQPWPFPSSLMIGCVADALDEALTIDREELEDARWFHRDEVALMMENRHPGGLRNPPPVAIAHHLIRSFLEGARG
jgi:NAD+ diphosphatase